MSSMEGLMMDFPLTLTHVMRRAETFFGDGEIVSRLSDKSFHRTNHRDALRRARQLAVALQKAGLERDEGEAAAMCYTSGTTGRPRGVVYSHRSSVLHAFGLGSNNPLGLGLGID